METHIVGGTSGFYVYEVQGVKVVQCPFFKDHMVKFSRLQYHLVKCKKRYSGPKLRCPYNATEYVEPKEYLEHLKTCTSKATYDRHFLSSQMTFPVRDSSPIQQTGVPSDENDDEW